MDITDRFMDIHLSSQLARFYRDIPMNIPGNIPRLARTLKALANRGIFSGIFLGISVKMVLAGLRDGYS